MLNSWHTVFVELTSLVVGVTLSDSGSGILRMRGRHQSLSKLRGLAFMMAWTQKIKCSHLSHTSGAPVMVPRRASLRYRWYTEPWSSQKSEPSLRGNSRAFYSVNFRSFLNFLEIPRNTESFESAIYCRVCIANMASRPFSHAYQKILNVDWLTNQLTGRSLNQSLVMPRSLVSQMVLVSIANGVICSAEHGTSCEAATYIDSPLMQRTFLPGVEILQVPGLRNR